MNSPIVKLGLVLNSLGLDKGTLTLLEKGLRVEERGKKSALGQWVELGSISWHQASTRMSGHSSSLFGQDEP